MLLKNHINPSLHKAPIHGHGVLSLLYTNVLFTQRPNPKKTAKYAVETIKSSKLS